VRFDNLGFGLQPFTLGTVSVHLLLKAVYLGKHLRGNNFVVGGGFALGFGQCGLAHGHFPPPIVYQVIPPNGVDVSPQQQAA